LESPAIQEPTAAAPPRHHTTTTHHSTTTTYHPHHNHEAYLALEDATIRGYFAQAAAHAEPGTDLLERVIDGIAEDIARYHTRGCPFINAAAEYPDPDSPVRRLIAAHRSWFRGALEQAAAGRDHPADVAASLVLLRNAALVGGYLDGIETTKQAFIRAARQAAGIAARG